MNEEFIKYVDQRLEQWAKWYSSGNSYGLGYPRRSIEHVMMTEGIIAKTGKSNILPCNEEAEEIEAFVLEMESQNKKMAAILRYHYFEPGALRIQAENYSAEYSPISYNTFKDNVDMARQWFAGRLSASHQNKNRLKNIAL
jgi:hypothetical protein